jgi:putative flippase GtrA
MAAIQTSSATTGTGSRLIIKELAAFGLVGAVGLTVDLVIFNALFADGQIVAKAISTATATAVTYLGNRHLSFKHRSQSHARREVTAFVGLNLAVLVASLAVLAVFEYPLHLKHHLIAMNLVNLASIAVGTVFRFYCYKRFVFNDQRSQVGGAG